MSEFRRHHSHLHTTTWLFKVYDFVKFDVLVAKYLSSLVADSDEFDSFFSDIEIGMQEVDLFESFELMLFFEVDTLVFVGDSEDSFFGIGGEKFSKVSFPNFSPFDNSSELIEFFFVGLRKENDFLVLGRLEVLNLGEGEFFEAKFPVFTEDCEIHWLKRKNKFSEV